MHSGSKEEQLRHAKAAMAEVEHNEVMQRIHKALRQLGITPNYRGFYYVAWGVFLCTEEPERLLLLTKQLYPEIAARCGASWKAVERGIRDMTVVAWRTNPELIGRLAGFRVCERPWPSQFLAILSTGLFPDRMTLMEKVKHDIFRHENRLPVNV